MFLVLMKPCSVEMETREISLIGFLCQLAVFLIENVAYSNVNYLKGSLSKRLVIET